MSYIDHNHPHSTAFEIQEMDVCEIQQVASGILPIAAAYWSIGIVGTLYVGTQSGLAAILLAYAVN